MLTLAGVSIFPEDLDAITLTEIGPRKNAALGSPVESVQQIFDDGQTTIGVWSCTEGKFPVTRGDTLSFMYILEGDATVVGHDGQEHELRPGVVFVEPAGWTGEWHIRKTIRKVYVIRRTN